MGDAVLVLVAAPLPQVMKHRDQANKVSRRVPEVLQESLVPSELPEVPGLQFACRYRPAAHVGGDWYDVTPLSDVRVGVAIGDVVGRGVQAASAMGQLRSALRIYALEGLSPGMLLERLNQLLHRLGEGDFSTLVYLTLDPKTGVVTFASAGHPPPLLVPDRGSADYLHWWCIGAARDRP